MGLPDIAINGNIIQVQASMPAFQKYRLFERAIMDGDLPVMMPLGVAVDTSDTRIKNILGYSQEVVEPVMQIADNVRDLLFYGSTSRGQVVYRGRENRTLKGPQYSGSIPWFANGYDIHCVEPDRLIFTALKPFGLTLIVRRYSGFRSMEENANLIPELFKGSTLNLKYVFFPLESNHNLLNYVHLAPYDGTDNIRVFYSNGMTPEILDRIWKEGKDYEPSPYTDV